MNPEQAAQALQRLARLRAFACRPHGYSTYRNGCRCAACRAAKADYQRKRATFGRQRARAAREAGTWGQPVEGITHGYAGWLDQGCRCGTCRAARAKSENKRRAARHAARELINGRLVATTTQAHGQRSTYIHHGCRCESCTEAQLSYQRHQRSSA